MILTKRKPATPLAFFLIQLARFMLVACLALAIVLLFHRVKWSHAFPIKTVQLYGVHHADHADIQQLLLPLVNKGFFTIDVDYIRDRLLQMPWIETAIVSRKWPDQVNITVTEKIAAARWDSNTLLSTTGELFAPSLKTYPAGLPDLSGPLGQQLLMLQYDAKMNHILLPIHARIAALSLSPYAIWRLTLDNGMTIELGHQAVLDRLAQFVRVYPQIVGNHANGVDYVDLRYANGLAVHFKQ